MENKVLIIGGSGFIGKNLILSYLERNFEVINFDISTFEVSNKNFENVIGSIDEIEKIEFIMKRHKISHVVFLVNTISPNDDFNNQFDIKMMSNVNSVVKILNLASKYRIGKFIYFSSGGAVYGNYKESSYRENDKLNPVNFYGWSKKIVEDFIISFSNEMKIDYLILRPSNPYGRFQNIFADQGIIAIALGKVIKNELLTIYGNGEVVKDYIYIDDLVKVYFMILESNNWNNIYNIGTGIGVNINKILEIIRKVTKSEIKVQYVDNFDPKIKVNILNVEKITSNVGEVEFLSINEGIQLFWKNCEESLKNGHEG